MKYFYYLFFTGLFFFETVAAQQAVDTLSFTVSHYTDEDGLPQNSVKDILQDDYGFTWLLTEAGIVRFDGREFRVFDKTTLSCIRSNRFLMAMRIPEMGSLAIAERGRHVQIRNGFVFCPPGPMVELNDLRLKWNMFPGTVSAITTGLPQKYRLENPENYIIPFGLEHYINCGRQSVYFRKNGLTDSVQFDSKNGCIGFFTVGQQLYYLKDSCWLSHIQPGSVRKGSIVGDILADKAFRPQQSRLIVFWNLAMQNAIFYYNRSFYEVESMPDGSLSTKLIFTGFDIGNLNFISFYYDKKNKHLILGSRAYGLYVLKKKTFGVLAEKKAGPRFYFAANIYDSTRLITPRGLLLKPGHIVSLTRKPGDVPGDSYQIQLDQFGHIWTKAAAKVYRYNRSFEPKGQLKLPGEVTSLYCPANDTNLWIGTRRSGLYQLSVSGSQQIAAPRLVVPDIPAVSFLVSESKEKLWIGTERGLYLLNRAARTLSCIDQLKNKDIRSIFVKSPEELWITTYGDGIFLLRNKKLNHMPYDQGNSLNTPHCMVLDQFGFFWISTNKGLIKASRKDMIAYADHQRKEVFYQYFGKESGFYSNEFNGGCQPCATQLPDGLIFFPSLDGMVQVDPRSTTEVLPYRELIVDKVEVDGHIVPFYDTLIVPRKFDNLSVALSTVYFGNRKNLQISYMLLKNGQEDHWYPVKGNTISFTSLPSGSYELKIRKVCGFGQDNFKTVSLRFSVPHAFYETIWFKLLIASGLLLIVYAYIRVRLYFILQRSRLLDLKIARRTRTLTNTLRALKVSEASLRRQTQMQEMLIAAISHDVKSPMKYLTMVSKRMQQQLSKKDYESLTAFNESIQDTSGKVYAILDNLVAYIGFQLKGGQVRKEPVDIFKLVEDKINLFSAIAAANNTQLRSRIRPHSFVVGDEALLAVIIHNLIDNAVKFTANGYVDIYEATPAKYSRFVLVIKDAGTGIPEELVRWLNAKADHGLDIGTIGSHKGMGLIIIKELLAAASADIYVVSGKEGTTISMYFNRYPSPTDL